MMIWGFGSCLEHEGGIRSHCKILSMGETEQGRSPCPGPTLGGGDRTLARNMEADQQMGRQQGLPVAELQRARRKEGKAVAGTQLGF